MTPEPPAPPPTVAEAARRVTAGDVADALAALYRGTPHAFGDSVSYDLVHAGRRYPPKAAFGVALGKYLGRPAVPADFSGGEDSLCFRVLRDLGFRVEPKPGPAGGGLPPVPPAQVWVEVTKAENKQGGPGWGLGEVLWSPARNAGGADTYKTMREVRAGDLVLHLVDGAFAGFSYAAEPCREAPDQPPQAGPWAGRGPYYRADLDRYTSFARPVPLAEFLRANDAAVRRALAGDGVTHFPFVEQGGGLITRQGGYLSRCPEALYHLIRAAVAGVQPAAGGSNPAGPAEPIGRRYWALGAGEGGRLWNEFQERGIAAIGWDELGDLTRYPTREAIAEALSLFRAEPDAPDPVNASLACHQFACDMKAGDYVVAKIGRKKVLGVGVVESGYWHDPGRAQYRHVRAVRWVKAANLELPEAAWVPTKTLTDVTDFREFVEFIGESLLRGDPPPAPPALLPPFSLDDALAGGLFLPRDEVAAVLDALVRKKNVILQGPPGVGKTFAARTLAYALIGAKDPARVEMVQFQPGVQLRGLCPGVAADRRRRVPAPDRGLLRLLRPCPDRPRPPVRVRD